jgi:glutamate racemase
MQGNSERSAPILFLDSGVGGLPYLELCRTMIPGVEMHYLADNAGFPYGLKSSGLVQDIVLDRVRRLRARFSPRALVIACNTASQAALQAVRSYNPELHVVGTVPAVKPAAEGTRSGVIGVLATERAVEDPYLDDLIARHASGVEVLRRPAQDLVDFVESRYLGSSPADRRNAVESHVRFFIERGVDRIVLACTHFLHVESDIAALATSLSGGSATVVDSRLGVARRLCEILGLGSCGESMPSLPVEVGQRFPGEGAFLLTGDPPYPPAYTRWASLYGLSGPARL